MRKCLLIHSTLKTFKRFSEKLSIVFVLSAQSIKGWRHINFRSDLRVRLYFVFFRVPGKFFCQADKKVCVLIMYKMR